MGAQTYTTLHLDGVNNIFVFMSIPNNQFFISLKSLFDKVLPFLKNSSNSFFGLYLYCTANCSWKHNANQKRQNIPETCLDQRFSYCCFIGKESHPVSPPMAHFAVDFWPTRSNASRLHLVTFRCVPKTPDPYYNWNNHRIKIRTQVLFNYGAQRSPCWLCHVFPLSEKLIFSLKYL